MEEWDEEILIIPFRNEDKNFKNLWGSLVTSDGNFSKLENIFVCHCVGGGELKDQSLEKYGDKNQICAAFKTLGCRKTDFNANMFN